MARYRLTRDYGNDRFFGRKGDVIEVEADDFARLEADSPGTFERLDDPAAEEAVEAGLMTERGAEIKAELEDQIPTIDLDPEDKAKEIPGEGNKFTPASGYNPAPQQARVVERASNRQVTDATKREAVAPADTSAQARVTDETPASIAADEVQLAQGVTAQDDDDAKAKAAAAKPARAPAKKG